MVNLKYQASPSVVCANHLRFLARRTFLASLQENFT